MYARGYIDECPFLKLFICDRVMSFPSSIHLRKQVVFLYIPTIFVMPFYTFTFDTIFT